MSFDSKLSVWVFLPLRGLCLRGFIDIQLQRFRRRGLSSARIAWQNRHIAIQSVHPPKLTACRRHSIEKKSP